MYCCMYAVARYSRAVGNAGSSSTAVLKCSTATGYWAFLNACTPLLSSSRDFSFWQLVPSTVNAAAARTSVSLRLINLLSGLHFGGHQADLVDTGTVCGVNRPSHP